MDSLESTMNTTTSPQVGRSTLREARLDEDEEETGLHPSHSGPDTLKVDTGTGGVHIPTERA